MAVSSPHFGPVVLLSADLMARSDLTSFSLLAKILLSDSYQNSELKRKLIFLACHFSD
jgi:hypothetical protein